VSDTRSFVPSSPLTLPSMSLSFATFAYVGVEVVAASALEAQWPRKSADDRTNSDISRRSNDTLIGNTVKFSSIFISFLATIAYSVSGLLASFDIQREDCQLPRLSWVNVPSTECQPSNTASAFVAIAQQSQIPHLADVFNIFLVFTCLTCANTNLYVASRALFGLTSRLDGGSGQPWYLRFLAYFGRTNHRKVPMRAMIFSAFAFCWVPFLQLRGGTSSNTPIGMVRVLELCI
jgi:amino acid transporter